MGNVELLVDLVLDRKTVAVPTSATLDAVTVHSGVTGHSVLDGTSQNVTWERKGDKERVRSEGRLKRSDRK